VNDFGRADRFHLADVYQSLGGWVGVEVDNADGFAAPLIVVSLVACATDCHLANVDAMLAAYGAHAADDSRDILMCEN